MENSRAEDFIRHRSKYVEKAPRGVHYYEQWVAGEVEVRPEFGNELRVSALKLMGTEGGTVRVSAIQALACVGAQEDIAVLADASKTADQDLKTELEEAIGLITLRHKPVEKLLAEVADRKSFVVFARALAKERERAQAEEMANRTRYALNGALGWNNGDISSFLYAALTEFDSPMQSEELSWQRVAKFLYLGKVLECDQPGT